MKEGVCMKESVCIKESCRTSHSGTAHMLSERWGAGVETHKNVRGEIEDGVEYHLMRPTPRR